MKSGVPTPRILLGLAEASAVECLCEARRQLVEIRLDHYAGDKARPSWLGHLVRDDPGDGSAAVGNDDLFAGRGALDQLRKVGFASSTSTEIIGRREG
jgi:hypothetical protein